MLTIQNIEEKLTAFGLGDRHKIYKIETTDSEYRFHIRVEDWDNQFKDYCIVLERKSAGNRDGNKLYKFYKTSNPQQPAYVSCDYISKIERMKHILAYVERDDRSNSNQI
jgi:hypothetical protein